MSLLPRALVLGAHRKGALKMSSYLDPHLSIVGVSDALKPLDPKLLGIMLRSFHPPIQLLSLGGVYTDAETDDARRVWQEYRAEVTSDVETYGRENGAKVGFVRTSSAEITAIKAELGIEGYESVARALLRNLEKL